MVQYGGDDTAARRLALEQRYGAERLVQLFDDDGDGVLSDADLLTLEELMIDADDIVTGLLIKKGFNEEGLRLYLRNDRQVIRAWSGIFAQLAGERKPEWRTNEGKGPYELDGVRARQELVALARGEIRSVTEATGAVNASVSGEVDSHRFEFSPDPDIPGDRGRGSF